MLLLIALLGAFQPAAGNNCRLLPHALVLVAASLAAARGDHRAGVLCRPTTRRR